MTSALTDFRRLLLLYRGIRLANVGGSVGQIRLRISQSRSQACGSWEIGCPEPENTKRDESMSLVSIFVVTSLLYKRRDELAQYGAHKRDGWAMIAPVHVFAFAAAGMKV